VRGRDSDSVDVPVLLQALDHQPLVVNRNGHDLQAGRGGGVAEAAPAGILYREPPSTARGQGPPQQIDAVAQPVRHHDLLGVRAHAAHPSEVGGERLAQLRCPGRVGVSQLLVGHAAQHSCRCGRPRRPRKAAERRTEGVMSWRTAGVDVAAARGARFRAPVAATVVPAPRRVHR
jgi:hypothetical protein